MSDRIRGIFALVLGVLMFFGGPPLILANGRKKAEAVNALKTSGKEIFGTVVRVDQKIKKSDQIRYSYYVDGRAYEATEDVPREVSDRYQPQAQIHVVYDTKHPETSTLDLVRLEETSKSMTNTGPWAMMAMGLFIAGLGYWRLRRAA